MSMSERNPLIDQVSLSNLLSIPASQLGAWEKVAEIETSTTVQEIDITGLAGDTDEFYLVFVKCHITPPTSGYRSTFIIFNDDTIAGNYEWTGYGVSPIPSWAGGTQTFGTTSGNPGLPFIQTYAGEIGGIGWAFIDAKGITIGTETYVTAIGLPGSLLHGWKITSCAWKKSAEVTEISLYCPNGAYIDAGTKLILFKPKW